MKNKDIDKLLELLDEELVQQKIIEIVTCQIKNAVVNQVQNNDESNSLLLQQLKTEKKSQDEKIERLEYELSEKQKELEKKKYLQARLEEVESERDQYKNMMNELVSDLEYYKNSFAKPKKIYDKYCGLSQNTMLALSNVLSNESVIDFIVKGVQWANLQGLEDYITANLNANTISECDMEILKEIYDELFELYSGADGNCHRLNTKVGEEFDLDYHVKGFGSKGVSGTIEKVLFDGYKKGNNVRRSIVLIEG